MPFFRLSIAIGAGCGSTSQTASLAQVPRAAPVTAAAQKKPPSPSDWRKKSAPIAGKWKATCAASGNLIIEFDFTGLKKSVGWIAELGAAGKYGYKQGEEIFRLEQNNYGDSIGKLKWRSVAGAERWESIRMVATDDKLNATMTTDDCYKNMPRVN